MCNCSKGGYVGSGLLLLVLCGTILTLTILGPGWIDDFLRKGINQKRLLTNQTDQDSYKNWQSNMAPGAPPAYLNLYVYNVTNPGRVLLGDKPILQQIGPYVYDWKWKRFNLDFLSNEELVSFFQSDYFVFNRTLTNSSLDPYTDMCTFPSIPYAAVRSNLGIDDQWWESMVFDLLSSFAGKSNVSSNDNSPFITISVDSYIWGYESPFLSWVSTTIAPLLNITVDAQFSIQTNLSSDSETIKAKKFPDVMYTGKNDSNLFNTYYKWQGKSYLNFDGRDIWGTPDANTVKGTDAFGFSVFIDKNQNLTVWVNEIYRHVNFITNQTEDLMGIPTQKYVLDISNFLPGPEYNLDAPSGVSNISSPNLYFKGSPVEVFLSQPHFFDADPFYSDNLIILPPNDKTDKTIHDTHLWVEPVTGVTLKASKRLQLNLKMKGSFFINGNMGTLYIPIAWFEQTSELTTAQANEWKSTVKVALDIKSAIPIVGYCVAGIMLLFAGAFFVLAYKKTRANYETLN